MMRPEKLSNPLPNRRSNRRSRFYLSLVILTLVAISARLYHVQKARAQSYGLMNVQQVTIRSEAVCRAIAPDVDGVSITVNRSEPNAPLSYWEATCTDKTGKNVTYLHWDAATGHLRYAGHLPVYPDYQIKSQLSREEAAGTAWKWVKALGLADKNNLWKVQPTLRRVAGNWEVRWQTAEQNICIMINANSGYLATAHINYAQIKA